ncbi:S41 family peptidase [Embleya sp. MST-111070]|uniref:S41 family peptidase n=1 Tax=Embleya sp. MST-111070 TaxID=3398231 RepID=UPI003F740129
MSNDVPTTDATAQAVPAESAPAAPTGADECAPAEAEGGHRRDPAPEAGPVSRGRGDRRRALTRKRRVPAALGVTVLAGVLVAGSILVPDLAASADSAGRPAACVAQDPTRPQPPAQTPIPTSVATVRQAYYCLFDNYYGGSRLDDRILLQYAFQAVVRELRKRGSDQPNAVLPALTGHRDKDWARFGKRLQEVLDAAPNDQALRSSLAVVAIQGMLAALHDNHAGYQASGIAPGPGAPRWGLGVSLNHALPRAETAPDFTGPLFATEVAAGSPAAVAGLTPGDIIESVNGVPAFTSGKLNPGVLDLLRPPAPQRTPVTLTIRRPATGETRQLAVTPGELPPPAQPHVDAAVLDGGMARIRFDAFYPGVAREILKAIADLRATTTLTGVIFDVRGNRGGVADEGNILLGAFIHDATVLSFCDANGRCDPQRVDDNTPLLHLPMVTLTDDGCASACEAFATGVKDLHLGTLIGTRTAGVNSGPARLYALADNTSAIRFPSQRAIGANGEIVDGIGVPPDIYAPLTAADRSTGQDPALAQATSLLEH